jgi:hypothetical protein
MKARAGSFIPALCFSGSFLQVFLAHSVCLPTSFPIRIKKSMAQNNKRRSPVFAMVVGLGLGLLIALVRKKIALGLLIGILVAAIIYKRDKR